MLILLTKCIIKYFNRESIYQSIWRFCSNNKSFLLYLSINILINFVSHYLKKKDIYID